MGSNNSKQQNHNTNIDTTESQDQFDSNILPDINTSEANHFPNTSRIQSNVDDLYNYITSSPGEEKDYETSTLSTPEFNARTSENGDIVIEKKNMDFFIPKKGLTLPYYKGYEKDYFSSMEGIMLPHELPNLYGSEKKRKINGPPEIYYVELVISGPGNTMNLERYAVGDRNHECCVNCPCLGPYNNRDASKMTKRQSQSTFNNPNNSLFQNDILSTTSATPYPDNIYLSPTNTSVDTATSDSPLPNNIYLSPTSDSLDVTSDAPLPNNIYLSPTSDSLDVTSDAPLPNNIYLSPTSDSLDVTSDAPYPSNLTLSPTSDNNIRPSTHLKQVPTAQTMMGGAAKNHNEMANSDIFSSTSEADDTVEFKKNNKKTNKLSHQTKVYDKTDDKTVKKFDDDDSMEIVDESDDDDDSSDLEELEVSDVESEDVENESEDELPQERLTLLQSDFNSEDLYRIQKRIFLSETETPQYSTHKKNNRSKKTHDQLWSDNLTTTERVRRVMDRMEDNKRLNNSDTHNIFTTEEKKILKLNDFNSSTDRLLKRPLNKNSKYTN